MTPSLFDQQPEQVAYAMDADVEKLLLSKDQGDFLADLRDDAEALGLTETEF